MKKFVQSTDPVVKSAMNDEEIVAKASLCEEKDITSLIKGEEEDETKDQVQRECGECCGGKCGNGRDCG
jgi:hypothetical protein